ncbi:hypothetical protein Acsp04_15750 [Actinomadura sp. NBRC 104425]|nr:hypothetical protein Acsp04_15750 [Actinomadura sp. NBRC 104425]
MWIATSTTDVKEALVSHRNAPFTPIGRLRLARCVVERPAAAPSCRTLRRRPHDRRMVGRPPQLGAAGMHDRTRPDTTTASRRK